MSSQRIVDPKTTEVEVADITKVGLTAVVESDQIPQKFQGKTVQDMIESYQNLERESGRQAQELGQLRSITDTLIQQNLKHSDTSAEKPQGPITEEEFLEKPIETVQRLVEEAVKPLKASTENARKQQALDLLERAHPDMRQLVEKQDFQDWVMASPVRQANWQRAANGDFDYANEMFTLYKELHKEPSGTTTHVPKNTQGLEDATTINRGSSRDASTANKPIYRRSDLVRLQIEDPYKYASLQQEIMQAYAEKRVVT